MSVQAITWAYAQDVHLTDAKFALVTLANRAGADGHCRTSRKRLAKDTGQSDRSVREHLSALEERGLIKEGMGDRDFSAWPHNLIPIEDDGETPTLACHNKMAGKLVELEHGVQLGRIIDRKIACEMRAWVWEAIRRRDGGPEPPAG